MSTFLHRRLWPALAASATLLLAGAASAADEDSKALYWSLGVASPGVSVQVGNTPAYGHYGYGHYGHYGYGHGSYYAPQPVYVAPAPVYVAPQPVYVAPAPVYHAPRPVYQRPAPVYHAPGDHHGRRHQRYYGY